MKPWLAIVAAVACLTVPALVSASDDTIIPPEARWSPAPPTPAQAMVPQERVVSTAPAQASDVSRPAVVQPTRSPLALTAQDAQYQMINRTMIE
jgi:hypothetical protein